MELLPCVARYTFAVERRTNLAAKESIGKPTRSPKINMMSLMNRLSLTVGCLYVETNSSFLSGNAVAYLV
jgi:hypothetical protein